MFSSAALFVFTFAAVALPMPSASSAQKIGFFISNTLINYCLLCDDEIRLQNYSYLGVCAIPKNYDFFCHRFAYVENNV